MIKRLTGLLPIVLAIFIVFTLVQSAPVQAVEPDYDLKVLVVSYQDREQLADLANRYDVVEVDSQTQTVKIFSNQITRDALASEGFTWTVDRAYTTLINTKVQAPPWQTSGIPGYACYRSVDEVYDAVDDLAAAYPNLTELRDIGDSWEKTINPNQGWDIQVLVLGDKTTPAIPKFNAFIMSGIHAREWAPVELNLRLAEYLLENYETDADVKWLLDYNFIHLLLVTNPDGRLQDEANQNWLWRKNTNNNYCTGGTGENGRGADLNRNYPFAWEAGNSQCSALYPGASKASEPETTAVINYVRTLFPDQRGTEPTDAVNELTATGMFIDIHSYSRLVLYPWGYTYTNAPNHNTLKTMSYKFAYYNGHAPQKSTDLYPSAGTTDDWAYGELGVPGFCFEVGDNFHQSCSVFENDINPRNLQALLRAIKLARKPYRLTYGPEITNLSFHVNPVKDLVVSYTADDTLYSNYQGGLPSQFIDSLRYSIDKPSWISDANAKTILLRKSVTKYSGQFTVSTDGLTPGQHILFVEALDNGGVWGPPTAIFFTTSVEETPVITPTAEPTQPPVILRKYYLPLIEAQP